PRQTTPKERNDVSASPTSPPTASHPEVGPSGQQGREPCASRPGGGKFVDELAPEGVIVDLDRVPGRRVEPLMWVGDFVADARIDVGAALQAPAEAPRRGGGAALCGRSTGLWWRGRRGGRMRCSAAMGAW